ncbi:unnamed protein product, partial [Heterosigma akashiwo]
MTGEFFLSPSQGGGAVPRGAAHLPERGHAERPAQAAGGGPLECARLGRLPEGPGPAQRVRLRVHGRAGLPGRGGPAGQDLRP